MNVITIDSGGIVRDMESSLPALIDQTLASNPGASRDDLEATILAEIERRITSVEAHASTITLRFDTTGLAQ